MYMLKQLSNVVNVSLRYRGVWTVFFASIVTESEFVQVLLAGFRLTLVIDD